MSPTDNIQYKAVEKKIKEIWDNVGDCTKYEDISIYHAGDRFPLMVFSCIYNAEFHNYLYNNDLDVYYNDDINNISIGFNTDTGLTATLEPVVIETIEIVKYGE